MYSLKLNLREIIGKFLKYEWIELEGRSGNPTMPHRLVEIDAYDNQNNLIKYLKKVLNNLGTEYVINWV